MKELDSFTVERLEEITELKALSFPPSHTESAALARIALAAKRAEPVGYLEQNHLDYLRSGSDADIWPEGGAGDIPVYLTPQLNSPEIPEGWPTEDMVIAGFESEAWDALSSAVLKRQGWPYSCRESAECVTGIFKSMLAAAPEPQNQQQNIPEIIPQGWIKCSDQMPEVGDVVITAYQGCTNIGQMERSGKTYRYFTSIVSGRELPATHWMPLPDAPEKENG
ncbi:DUF551 domain-containing protein [Yersinia mollaretii]|uniref:Protein of uncharacterized function (DUF551) n=1 Tax=Yersinia mollaretii TaxID=33060 RepID=A0AA36LQK1_YERMO|nr:DUF551 domain-containing protein [Yersinia mollaretii]CNI33418.1 Protein of uncharacterised function (DUF551) [Yersinia mollaretii]